MSRPRDRKSAEGLLPRMEARPRKNGFTYRYHPVGGKPIGLGTDRDKAIRAVLDLNGDNSDRNTLNELWRLYQETPAWKDLAQGSRDDYLQCSKELLKVLGKMAPGAIKPAHIARYLRVERAAAPVRANREFALLSNLLKVATERGELDVNPCKQVRRNKERPRKSAPEPANLATFLEWAWSGTGQSPVLAGMAEFASIASNRGIEFRELTWPQVGEDVIRIIRSKQRDKEVVEIIAMDGLLTDLMRRMRLLAKDERHGWVFPNSQGMPIPPSRSSWGLPGSRPQRARPASWKSISRSMTCGLISSRNTRRNSAIFQRFMPIRALPRASTTAAR